MKRDLRTLGSALHPALAALAAALVLVLLAPPAQALGRLADIDVLDRTTGRTLPIHTVDGQHWIAGIPGHRYGIVLRNRTGDRILNVVAVDGVNAVSGDTAAWSQTGYVLAPWEDFQVLGWRKTNADVAAFEFSRLDDSYAARTGRPDHAGVIGVAVFRERQTALAAEPWLSQRKRAAGDQDRPAAASAAPGTPPRAMSSQDSAQAPRPSAKAERLGTGHGARETSIVANTDFEREHVTPDEIIAIRYDSRENLIAMGIISNPHERPIAVPFPNSSSGYVPDPPPGR